MSLSLLTIEHIFDPTESEIIKGANDGVKASDLAIIQGADGKNSDKIKIIDSTRPRFLIRPILNINADGQIQPYPLKTEELFYGSMKASLTDCELGMYPQTVADRETSSVLDSLFPEGLRVTRNKYTFNKGNIWRDAPYFHPYSCVEYEYKDQTYIRILGQPANGKSQLSNGEYVVYGKPYWVKVEPISGYTNKEKNIFIAEKGLISGIPLNHEDTVTDHFEESFIYEYLHSYFINEIGLPTRISRQKNTIFPLEVQHSRS